MSPTIDLERVGDVFVVRWRDGENRFNATSVSAWVEVLDEVDAAPTPKALVAVGEGKFWSNGLDLDWLRATADGATFIDGVHRLLVRVLTAPYLTVAALNGHAFAAGAMLATAFDVRIMREDRGYWCLPEADLGLPLTPVMHAVVTAKLPKVTAHEAILTGRRYSAAEAVAAGIAHEAAPEAEVLDRARARAAELAGKQVVAEHKALLYGDVARLLDA